MAPGDIVIVDRNCHKSILHAITLTGAIPVFLMPTRNHYGIIGPIPLSEFDWESIEKKIAANPLIKDKKAKPRIMTITQSTYDGIVYNDEVIKAKLDGKVDILHFDEAWLPHAAFHSFYDNMHAIDRNKPRTKKSMVLRRTQRISCLRVFRRQARSVSRTLKPRSLTAPDLMNPS